MHNVTIQQLYTLFSAHHDKCTLNSLYVFHPSPICFSSGNHQFSIFKSLGVFFGLFVLCSFVLFLFLKKSLFIYFERERERARVQAWAEEGQREMETESQPGSTLPEQSLTQALTPTVRLWPELKSRVQHSTNWATQVLLFYFLNSTYEWNHIVFVFLLLTYFT